MPRGRKPVPTKLKILRGNPGRRPLNKDEPQPPLLTTLTPPVWLSAKAKEHWNATAPGLIQMGLLTVLDVHGWSLACSAWAHAMELNELIAHDGMILPTDTGGKLHPAFRAEEKWFELYLKISREFGCTPASRVSLHVQPPPDELDAFLNRKNARKATTDKSRFFRQKPDQMT